MKTAFVWTPIVIGMVMVVREVAGDTELEYYGTEGESIILPCNNTNDDDDVDVNWYYGRDSATMLVIKRADKRVVYPSQHRLKGRINLVNRASLHIKSLSFEHDSGVYTCEVGFSTKTVITLYVAESTITADLAVSAVPIQPVITRHKGDIAIQKYTVDYATTEEQGDSVTNEEPRDSATKKDETDRAESIDNGILYIAVGIGSGPAIVLIVIVLISAAMCYNGEKWRKPTHSNPTVSEANMTYDIQETVHSVEPTQSCMYSDTNKGNQRYKSGDNQTYNPRSQARIMESCVDIGMDNGSGNPGNQPLYSEVVDVDVFTSMRANGWGGYHHLNREAI